MKSERRSPIVQNDGNIARLFDNLPKLARPEAVASVLGISVKTIYDWRYRGKRRGVPERLFLRFNRALFIQTDILEAWIASQNPVEG